MHEYALATEIVRISLDRVEESNQKQKQPAIRTFSSESGSILTGLKLKIGTLAGVFPDSLKMYLELLFTDQGLGPVYIDIESIPARFICRCGYTYTSDLILSPCPVCDGFEREMIEGNQCFIDSIEITDITQDKGKEHETTTGLTNSSSQ